MTRHASFFVFVFAVASLLPAIPALAKQPAAPGPIPAQIFAAKKVFIVNAGGDQMAENDPQFTGGSSRAYDEFYAAAKSWGRFEIVGSPAEADLLLEIRQEVQIVSLGTKIGGSATPLFHLQIRDPRTNVLLWGFHVHSQFGLGQGNSDRYFDQAIERLMLDLQQLMAQGPAAAAASAP